MGNVNYNGTVCLMLSHCIQDLHNTENIPSHVKTIIQEEMWKEYRHPNTGEIYSFTSFEEFVTKHNPMGLGISLQTLKNLCRDDTVAVDLIDQVCQGKQGRPKNGNNIPIKPRPEGTSKDKGLRKLRKYAESDKKVAALYQEALKDKISVHRAGKPKKETLNNIQGLRPNGTSQSYGLRKLRKHAEKTCPIIPVSNHKAYSVARRTPPPVVVFPALVPIQTKRMSHNG